VQVRRTLFFEFRRKAGMKKGGSKPKNHYGYLLGENGETTAGGPKPMNTFWEIQPSMLQNSIRRKETKGNA